MGTDGHKLTPGRPIRKPQVGADDMSMTTTTCCGSAPRDITIATSTSSLTFLYCERCESRQWFRDGEAVELGVVKAQAAAQWNRKLISA
jgi:hypothetical protein